MSETTYRVGIAGFAHMHINNVAAQFARHPQVEWAGCADTTPTVPEQANGRYTRAWNKAHVTSEFNVQPVYESVEELLEKGKPNVVIVCSENRYHAELVEACAAAEAHACVEKPMAMSLADGLRMVHATERAGTALAVNWPIAWSPALHRFKQLVDDGAIGDVLQVKYRAGHTGPLGPGVAHAGGGGGGSAEALSGTQRASSWWHRTEEGGGALIDFCCYGAMLSRWLIGEQALDAVAVKANLNSHWGEADDNAIMITRFPNALGLFEGTWTTRHHGIPTGPVAYGTEGTLVLREHEGRMQLRLETQGEPQWIEPPPAPQGRTTIAEELLHHLETGDPLLPLLDIPLNLDALAILEAGRRAAETGRCERVPSRTHPA